MNVVIFCIIIFIMKLYKSKNGGYNFVMAYPAVEEFALSSLGYMWLYKIADEKEEINVLRISTDNIDINSENINSIAFPYFSIFV